PPDYRVDKRVCQFLLASLSFSERPLSFEIVGSSEEIRIQFAAFPEDAAQLRRQLLAYFPETVIHENGNSLLETWTAEPGEVFLADFGLAREFVLPLNCADNFQIDPLIPITAVLSELEPGEV